MEWLEKIKAAVPQLTLTQTVSGKQKLLPREVLAKNIADSIALLGNAEHTITVRGKEVKPEPCYVLRDSKAKITLRYCRQSIKLDGNDDTIIVDGADLATVLTHLKAAVEAKEFDGQLGAIKAQRMAQLGKGKTGKKAA